MYENFLNNFAWFKGFRDYEGINGDKFSQKDIIDSALNEEDLFAVLPTGGGKSLCFQLPAIYESLNNSALTLIISPLRALMRDQVDNFKKKFNFDKVEALIGDSDFLEKSNISQKVISGDIDILYLSPEALRYNRIRDIIKEREVSRVVIDEAHTLSIWGNDFRPDFMYIKTFIEKMAKLNSKNKYVSVSCFTATATKDVIEDIKRLFSDRNFKFFIAKNERDNLSYKAVFGELRGNFLEYIKPPCVVYVPNSKSECEVVNESINNKYRSEFFHSGVKNRDEILEKFKNNELEVIVATSAFGMGIDKEDIKTIIHYKPSRTLEDYLQETGRAARSKDIKGECIVFFDEKDFENYQNELKINKVSFEQIEKVFEFIKQNKRIKKFNPEHLMLANDIFFENNSLNKLEVILTELELNNLIKRENRIVKDEKIEFDFDKLKRLRKDLLKIVENFSHKDYSIKFVAHLYKHYKKIYKIFGKVFKDISIKFKNKNYQIDIEIKDKSVLKKLEELKFILDNETIDYNYSKEILRLLSILGIIKNYKKVYEIEVLSNASYTKDMYNERLGKFYKLKKEKINTFHNFLNILFIKGFDKNFVKDYFNVSFEEFNNKELDKKIIEKIENEKDILFRELMRKKVTLVKSNHHNRCLYERLEGRIKLLEKMQNISRNDIEVLVESEEDKKILGFLLGKDILINSFNEKEGKKILIVLYTRDKLDKSLFLRFFSSKQIYIVTNKKYFDKLVSQRNLIKDESEFCERYYYIGYKEIDWAATYPYQNIIEKLKKGDELEGNLYYSHITISRINHLKIDKGFSIKLSNCYKNFLNKENLNDDNVKLLVDNIKFRKYVYDRKKRYFNGYKDLYIPTFIMKI